MTSTWRELAVSDGSNMAAYTVQPEKGSGRGVIVLQEAFGVNAHIRDVAGRLAGLGNLAIAPDVFHRTAPRFEGDYSDFRKSLPHTKAVTLEGVAADLHAAHDWLSGHGITEVAAVGFCMGGRLAVRAAQVLPLRAAASFYGGNLLSLGETVAEISAPLLLVWGDRDTHIPPEQRAEFVGRLREKGKSFVECTFSRAGHGFFCDQRESYEPESAREAWALLTAFLQR
jgi:carboxymethylenebutenolidase